MRRFANYSLAAMLGLALAAVGGSQVLADQVLGQAASSYNGSGFSAHFKVSGGTNNTSSNESSAAVNFFSWTGTGQTIGAPMPASPRFKTYCVDIGDNIAAGVDAALVGVVSGSTTTADSDGKIRNLGAAGWAVNTYSPVLNVVSTSSAWGNLYALSGVASATYAQQVAVVQTAVWALAYGTLNQDGSASTIAATNLGNAYINTTGSDETKLLQALLGQWGGQTQDAGFINYPPFTGNTSPTPPAFRNQDMLYAVPEPSSLAIAGLGALGFLGYGLKRRKNS